MRSRPTVLVRHAVMIAVLVIVTVWLWQLDMGRPVPPGVSLDAPRAFIDSDDAVTFVIALVRLVALGFSAYLLVLATMSGIVRWLALPRAVRVVDRLTLPFLRVVLSGAATLGVFATPPTPSPFPGPVTTVPAAPPAVVAQPQGDDQATLHLLPAEESSVADVTPPASSADTWTVEPGESFWVIARSHLAATRGSTIDDRAVDAYWRRLIEANRDRLANPDDPNLLFADQELVLPPVDAG